MGIKELMDRGNYKSALSEEPNNENNKYGWSYEIIPEFCRENYDIMTRYELEEAQRDLPVPEVYPTGPTEEMVQRYKNAQTTIARLISQKSLDDFNKENKRRSA